MSWNATVDRLRGQAQQYGLANDYVTAKILYEAVDEIERITRERDEARAQADVWNDPEALARAFHDTYERLAPDYGYTTRGDTRTFDPDSPNGRLMVAVCAALAALPKEDDR